MSEKKNYEHYLEDETETWGEYFDNLRKYWRGAIAEVRDDMNEFLNGYDEVRTDMDKFADDPEMMDLMVDAGRAKTLANLTELTMGAIGNCLEATANLFGRNKALPSDRTNVQKGDHICIRKGIKAFHGIYVGNRDVVCFTKGFDMNPKVKLMSFASFAQNGTVEVVPTDQDMTARFTADDIIRRAKSRVGEDEFRTSESFVNWCRCGR